MLLNEKGQHARKYNKESTDQFVASSTGALEGSQGRRGMLVQCPVYPCSLAEALSEG